MLAISSQQGKHVVAPGKCCEYWWVRDLTHKIEELLINLLAKWLTIVDLYLRFKMALSSQIHTLIQF